MYAGIISIPYSKINNMHPLPDTTKRHLKKTLPGNSKLILFLFIYCNIYYCCLLIRVVTLVTKIKTFYNPSIQKVLKTSSGMPYKFFSSRHTVQGYLPWAKEVFLQRALKYDTGRVFNNTIWLWIDTQSCKESTLRDSSTAVEKSGILVHYEEAAEKLVVILDVMCSVLRKDF